MIKGVTIPTGEINGTSGIIGTDTRLANATVGTSETADEISVYTGTSLSDVEAAVQLPAYPQDGEYIITGSNFLIEYSVNPDINGAYPPPMLNLRTVATEVGGTLLPH